MTRWGPLFLIIKRSDPRRHKCLKYPKLPLKMPSRKGHKSVTNWSHVVTNVPNHSVLLSGRVTPPWNSAKLLAMETGGMSVAHGAFRDSSRRMGVAPRASRDGYRRMIVAHRTSRRGGSQMSVAHRASREGDRWVSIGAWSFSRWIRMDERGTQSFSR